MSEPATTITIPGLIKTAPPMALGAWQLFGHSLPENVSALTLVWIGLLIGEKVGKWIYAAWTRRK